MTTVCIVSGGDEVRYRSYINQSVYAREHGFSFHLGVGLAQGITSPYYFKFEVIEEILPRFDWVVWMDDDVYITDMTSPTLEKLLEEAVANDRYLVIAEGCKEPDGSWTPINTGVMALRNDPRSFELLRDARALSPAEIRPLWNEDELGLFTNGDQDTIWWAMQAKPHLRDGVDVVSHRLLNSRPHYYESSLNDAFAVHFCGPGDKVLKIALFGKRFGLGQELVSDDLLDTWSVRKRDRLSEPDIAYRKARWAGNQFAKRVRRKIDFVRETGRWK